MFNEIYICNFQKPTGISADPWSCNWSSSASFCTWLIWCPLRVSARCSGWKHLESQCAASVRMLENRLELIYCNSMIWNNNKILKIQRLSNINESNRVLVIIFPSMPIRELERDDFQRNPNFQNSDLIVLVVAPCLLVGIFRMYFCEADVCIRMLLVWMSISWGTRIATEDDNWNKNKLHEKIINSFLYTYVSRHFTICAE